MQVRTTVLYAALSLACLASAHADTLDKVAQSGQITLAYRESSVPFSYLNQSKPAGISVDISNAVVEAVKKATGKNDIKVNWQAVTSQNRIPLLTNGTNAARPPTTPRAARMWISPSTTSTPAPACW